MFRSGKNAFQIQEARKRKKMSASGNGNIFTIEDDVHYEVEAQRSRFQWE
jgi:hypothetical protein